MFKLTDKLALIWISKTRDVDEGMSWQVRNLQEGHDGAIMGKVEQIQVKSGILSLSDRRG